MASTRTPADDQGSPGASKITPGRQANGGPQANGGGGNGNPPAPAAPAAVEIREHSVPTLLWTGCLSSCVSGVISTLLVALIIAGGSLYISVRGENDAGFVLRDVAPQVQLIPDNAFGRVPGTQSGIPLEHWNMAYINRKMPYMKSCGQGQVDNARYLFQALTCSDSRNTDPNAPRDRVFFFYNKHFLGTDSLVPSFRATIKDRDSATITVEYDMYHWNGTAYEPTYGTESVPFQLPFNRRNVTIAESPIPPQASHTADGR